MVILRYDIPCFGGLEPMFWMDQLLSTSKQKNDEWSSFLLHGGSPLLNYTITILSLTTMRNSNLLYGTGLWPHPLALAWEEHGTIKRATKKANVEPIYNLHAPQVPTWHEIAAWNYQSFLTLSNSVTGRYFMRYIWTYTQQFLKSSALKTEVAGFISKFQISEQQWMEELRTNMKTLLL
jgi:hypothetical protein